MVDALIVYMPVLHEGYRRFFKPYTGTTTYLVDPQLVADELPRLSRDRRKLHIDDALCLLRASGWVGQVQVLDAATLAALDARAAEIVMPVDEVSDVIAAQLPNCRVRYEQVFLRWDKTVTLQELEVQPNVQVTDAQVHQELMTCACTEAERSGDWWRQVGAVAVRDGEVVGRGFNAHTPTEHVVYEDGNPRDNFDAGEHPDISLTLHGEAGIVARAARSVLAGTSMYVTTFPCINCARLLAEAGVSKIYYREGYSRLDAEQVLKEQGVEIIRVV